MNIFSAISTYLRPTATLTDECIRVGAGNQIFYSEDAICVSVSTTLRRIFLHILHTEGWGVYTMRDAGSGCEFWKLRKYEAW